MSESDDPIMWYLKFHKEPKPGVIFYTQSVPLDALNKVKQEYETLTKQLEIAMETLEMIADADKSGWDENFKGSFLARIYTTDTNLAREALAEIEKLKEPK